MNDFIKNFKNKAHNKDLTSSDMLALCLYRAIKAKSPEKTAIAKHFMFKSFSPNKSGEYRGLNKAARNLHNRSARLTKNAETGKYEYTYNIMGFPLSEVFSEEESQMYIDMTSMKHEIYGVL